MAQALTDSNFAEIVEQGELPVLVDFWATWCGPCRMISPIVDKMAEKYAGQVNVVKCNVDESTDIPMKFGIRNIPTLLFFKGGELVDRVVGAVSQAELEKHIEKLRLSPFPFSYRVIRLNTYFSKFRQMIKELLNKLLRKSSGIKRFLE